MYLVVGATGPVGSGGRMCRQLRVADNPVRALDVRPQIPTGLRAWRASESNSSPATSRIRVATRGLSGESTPVISTASMMVSNQEGDRVESVDGTGQNDLVDAAMAAGVGSFVYVSFSQHIDRDFPFRNAKRGVEHLKQSRLVYTILRPTFLMEVWLSPMRVLIFVMPTHGSMVAVTTQSAGFRCQRRRAFCGDLPRHAAVTKRNV